MDRDELERRRAVWRALSDLFLDTETRWWLPRVAAVLVKSGYSPQELQRIWEWEIFPECADNIIIATGDWVELALDESALVRRAERDPNPVARLLGWLLRASFDLGWPVLMALTRRLQQLPPERRDAVVCAWSAFAKAYLEESLDRVVGLDLIIESLRSCGLSPTDCAVTFAADFQPLYATLLVGKERSVEWSRAENVRALLARAFG